MAQKHSPAQDGVEIITTNVALEAFCEQARTHDFVTIDTEFYVRRTYYAKLCLIQLAYGSDESGRAVLLDPLADGIKLEGLKPLLTDESVVKVFHAARQDIEILYEAIGVVPHPFFDTQIGAMVCGFGGQTSYEKLVKHFANAEIDKSNRFTDWRKRPLSANQQLYALADATHLRTVYEGLCAALKKNQRGAWIVEETKTLLDIRNYSKTPDEAWRRLKFSTKSKSFTARVMCLAAFREKDAQRRDLPRGFILRDEQILEIAASAPKNINDLIKISMFSSKSTGEKLVRDVMQALKKAETFRFELPPAPLRDESKQKDKAVATLLRVLLKIRAKAAGVAEILITSTAELDEIATGNQDVACLKGWRYEVFGRDALALCGGGIAIRANRGKLEMIAVEKPNA